MEKALHSFNMKSRGGCAPTADVILDSSGNIYGTREAAPTMAAVGVDALILGKSGQLYGATASAASGGAYLNGSIFELIPNNGKWTEQLLFSFNDRTDAGLPDGNLILDANGNIYGTTEFGGTHDSGTVFEVTP
jgi:uncharacterized repeat protein (TIGR03803 family)